MDTNCRALLPRQRSFRFRKIRPSRESIQPKSQGDFAEDTEGLARTWRKPTASTCVASFTASINGSNCEQPGTSPMDTAQRPFPPIPHVQTSELTRNTAYTDLPRSQQLEHRNTAPCARTFHNANSAKFPFPENKDIATSLRAVKSGASTQQPHQPAED